MKKGCYAAVTLVVLAVAVAAFGVGRGAQATQSLRPAQQQQAARALPEHIVYGILLHHVHVFSQEAERAEGEGRADSARAFRNAFPRDAGLNDWQARVLNEVAAECEAAVREVDARAKVIIDARRAHYQSTGEALPPSPELAALQRERDLTVLRYRDKLRSALGEQEWARFQEFVRRRVTPTISLTAPGAPPNPGAARKTEQ